MEQVLTPGNRRVFQGIKAHNPSLICQNVHIAYLYLQGTEMTIQHQLSSTTDI